MFDFLSFLNLQVRFDAHGHERPGTRNNGHQQELPATHMFGIIDGQVLDFFRGTIVNVVAAAVAARRPSACIQGRGTSIVVGGGGGVAAAAFA